MSIIFVKMLFFISVSCCWFAGQNSAAPSRTTGRMLNTSVRQPSAGFEDSQTEGNKTKTCIVRKSKSLSQTSTCSVVKELCLIFSKVCSSIVSLVISQSELWNCIEKKIFKKYIFEPICRERGKLKVRQMTGTPP